MYFKNIIETLVNHLKLNRVSSKLNYQNANIY